MSRRPSRMEFRILRAMVQYGLQIDKRGMHTYRFSRHKIEPKTHHQIAYELNEGKYWRGKDWHFAKQINVRDRHIEAMSRQGWIRHKVYETRWRKEEYHLTDRGRDAYDSVLSESFSPSEDHDWDHNELCDAVCAKLNGSPDVFAFREIAAGSSMVDVMALGVPQAAEATAYEIKVSRADFLAEIREPYKRRGAQIHSQQFYIVTPPGIAHPKDMPDDIGLIEIDSAIRFHVVVDAPTSLFTESKRLKYAWLMAKLTYQTYEKIHEAKSG